MPVTASAVPFFTNKSLAALVAATHSPASPELITVNHNLPAAPKYAVITPRSIVAYGGALSSPQAAPALSFRGANASQAYFDGVGAGIGSSWAATSPSVGFFDLLLSIPHSFVD